MARKRRKTPFHIVAAGSAKYSLTKIDVAELLISTAIRLFFEGAHPVPIYALASAAREILTTLGDKTGIETVLHAVAKRQGKSLKELATSAHTFAGFFKHADRDPQGVLQFSETDVDPVLAMAVQDFGRITGGMPVEGQVFELWIYALAFAKVSEAPLKGQRVIKLAIKQFPGIRTADRRTQKKLGLEVLNRIQHDPTLKMEFSREVRIAAGGESAENRSSRK